MADLQDLGLNRFGEKEPNQDNTTKGAVYASVNPSPKQIDEWRKIGQGNKSSEEDRGAPNILTGTVITSCFIQTSALPSRVEIAGNDITFYDDTSTKNGTVSGDTSRIFFTHDLDSNEGFIIEKRASIYNTYDNVFSIYSLPAKEGAYNYMFIGRTGNNADNNGQRNLSSLRIAIDKSSTGPSGTSAQGQLNGIFAVEHSVDGVQPIGYQSFASGNTASLIGGSFTNGYSSYMLAGDGGVTGIGYRHSTGTPTIMLYITSEAQITLGASLVPDTANSYTVGSASFPLLSVRAKTVFMGNMTWSSGAGSPEGVVVAPIGSLYSNTSGGTLTTLYVKTSGSSSTGWTAK